MTDSTADPTATRTEQTLEFEGLTIRFDHRVLRPRPWTSAQSQWAAQLLATLPAGPVLELCAGAAHIGLAAVAGTRRRLVCVERDPVAADFAAANAEAAGMAGRVVICAAPMAEALMADEQFALIIADPPWVPQNHTGSYPEDPVTAIDGGPDGLALARECIGLIGSHLAAGGTALLQLGSPAQAAALAPDIEAAELATIEVRRYARGVITRLEHPVAQ
jgi:methylase of polypeptide subunit release factors